MRENPKKNFLNSKLFFKFKEFPLRIDYCFHSANDRPRRKFIYFSFCSVQAQCVFHISLLKAILLRVYIYIILNLSQQLLDIFVTYFKYTQSLCSSRVNKDLVGLGTQIKRTLQFQLSIANGQRGLNSLCFKTLETGHPPTTRRDKEQAVHPVLTVGGRCWELHIVSTHCFRLAANRHFQ